jgi:hypothetical protein
MNDSYKEYFDPNTIDDWFWNVIHRAEKNRSRLETILLDASKEDIVSFYNTFTSVISSLWEDELWIELMVQRVK